MGGSGKWIKSLIGLKKPQSNEKGRKWKLWRTASGGHVSATSEAASDYSSDSGAAFNAAVAAVVRAPVKDFLEVRREWAALRIQAVFRSFLARQALRALKAVVRLQAIFRGRQVRKKADVTFKCMQALVRVQARARAQSSTQTESNLTALSLDTSNLPFDPTKLGEVMVPYHPTKLCEVMLKEIIECICLDQWCNSPGTIEEVRAKMQMKHQGAIKRERAIAYAMSKPQLTANPSINPKTAKPVVSHKLDKNGTGATWLDRWMAQKPWETRSTDEINLDQSEPTRVHKKHDDYLVGSRASFSELDSMKIRRNNVSTRISAKPPMSSQLAFSPSNPCSEVLNDESSTSTMEGSFGDHKPPNYMNPTKSIKAKQRTTPYSSHNFAKKPMETSRNGGTDLYSVCKDLYPPMHLDRYDFVKSLRE